MIRGTPTLLHGVYRDILTFNIYTVWNTDAINPYPANVENMVSS